MNEVTEPRRALNIEEAARALNLSVKTVRREIQRGRLSYRIEGLKRYAFDPEFIEAYRRRNTVEATTEAKS